MNYDNKIAEKPKARKQPLQADIPALTDILLYHVVDGKVMAADVVGLDGQKVETLSGNTFMVKLDNGVYVGDAMVIITDIEASNGVIHVIDSVLLP